VKLSKALLIDPLFSLLGWLLDIIVLSKWSKSSEKGARAERPFFFLLGLFGLPVGFRFLNGYDILKNDGLIILLSVGLL